MSYPIASTLLDAVVLSVLEHKDLYGYRITQGVRQNLDVSESTLYPVLRRLQKNGCLATYDRSSDGRNRRYYSITGLGRAMLRQYRLDWVEYRQQIEYLLFPEGGSQQ
ncbi:MAG: PadR family transcriptional regulator [Eubacteriales bacterium]|nr:PadR family transcriptional regulator [Eubacteriales bacterium]